MPTPLWPYNALPLERFAFNLAPRNLRGPSSVSGVSQIVSQDAGLWQASIGRVYLPDLVSKRLWAALDALMEGGMHPILIPYYVQDRPILPEWKPLYRPVRHSDLSLFSDGTAYQGGVVDVVLATNVPVRGTTAGIHINVGHELQPGQHFSFGERLYRLRTVEYTSENAATITFRPPAREAVTIGERLEFDFPVCRMRLAGDSQMDLEHTPTISSRTARFIEDI